MVPFVHSRSCELTCAAESSSVFVWRWLGWVVMEGLGGRVIKGQGALGCWGCPLFCLWSWFHALCLCQFYTSNMCKLYSNHTSVELFRM